MIEPGHFHTCRLWDGISLTELLSSLILFDAPGCNELLKTTWVSGDLQLTGFSSCIHVYYRLHTVWKFHMELGHSVCFTVIKSESDKLWMNVPGPQRETLSLFSDCIFQSLCFMTKFLLKSTLCPGSIDALYWCVRYRCVLLFFGKTAQSHHPLFATGEFECVVLLFVITNLNLIQSI